MTARRHGKAAIVSVAATLALGLAVSTASGPDGVARARQQDDLPLTVERVSVAPNGQEANGHSVDPAISADGRVVAFASAADNLVPGDTNHSFDVFVLDRQTGEITRVSVSSSGAQANGVCFGPDISIDGRFVVFASTATNLVAGDTNNQVDVFLHDRSTRQTTRVSLTNRGGQANRACSEPLISGDGLVVVFDSTASNLVAGDTNQTTDTFARDLRAATTTRVSLASDGTQQDFGSQRNWVSHDGRFVAFHSSASNLVPGDTNSSFDVFLRDRLAGHTERLSVGPGGVQANGHSVEGRLSPDLRVVVFSSRADNLVESDGNREQDVFVRDLVSGVVTRASVTTGGEELNSFSREPAMGADGRIVAFITGASNVIPGTFWLDLVVRDLVTSVTRPAAMNLSPNPSLYVRDRPRVSADGRFLVPGDRNNRSDVFVSSPLVPTTALTVETAGNGRGTVTSDPWGLVCPPQCSSAMVDAAEVELVPAAAEADEETPPSVFAGWTGDPDCDDGVVTMNSPVHCIATFREARTLMVVRAGSGTGQVTSVPDGIDCGASCAGTFVRDTVVRLVAQSNDGSVFAGWSGDEDCLDGDVTLAADKTCIATFERGRRLTVQVTGAGSGVVTSTPAGVLCPDDCREYYPPGQVVTLTATPGATSVFKGFAGAADCRDGRVTMTTARRCVARFEPARTP